MPSARSTILSALAGAAGVAAHGHVNSVIINGVEYAGYDVTSMPYQNNPPAVIGWANDATDNGFVGPEDYANGDIICHKGAKNAKGHAEVAAGDKIYIQWTEWPESHKGPVIDYLASCGEAGCESVDKTSLEFFKIDEVGLVSAGTPGTYGGDQLIKNNNGWMVQIPESVKPGNYVLRHEIIALHSAGQENGAQNYPQCFNLKVTGSGTTVPEGTAGTSLYKADDAGILFSIYDNVSEYPIPGPKVIEGYKELEQATSAATSTGSATVGNAAATGAAGSGSGAAATTEAAAPAATTAAAKSAAAEAEAPAATSAAAQPAQTAAASKCKSKKVRRHVRDVKHLNVAPINRQ